MADWATNENESLINPQPVIVEEPDLLISDFLSPLKLQEISGQENLNNVEFIEMIVDTTDTTLGNFGQYLPSLKQLKLNDSCIPSVRDIGTAFNHLSILWMSRCKLKDIDGIASMNLLQELYISYNNIEDLSPISFLDCLEVLDLEGNAVSDVNQIDYLSNMSNLTTLTLTGNPICKTVCSLFNQSFKDYIVAKLPDLKVLNDVDTSSSEPEEMNFALLSEDMDIITNAIKVATDLEEELDSITIDSSLLLSSKPEATSSNQPTASFSTSLNKFLTPRPSTALPNRKSAQFKNTAYSLSSPIISSSTRPGSGGSDNGILGSDDSSNLTFGDPLCGNPLQALKHRKRVPGFLNSLYNEHSDVCIDFVSRPATSLGFRMSKISKKPLQDFSKNNLSPATDECIPSSLISSSSNKFVNQCKDKFSTANAQNFSSSMNGIHQQKSSTSFYKVS